MDTIRPLVEADIPAVAALFMKVFRRGGSVPAALKEYLGDLYLRNPWADPDIPSLVYEKDRKLLGFIGALPFPMRMKGERIRAVIGGNYMVDPDLRDPFAGVRILKRFFQGPQDLTMSDTANETSRKMWEVLGSSTAQIFSMQWLRILRPGRFALSLGRRSPPLSLLNTVARPAAAITDGMADWLRINPLRPGQSDLTATELDTTTLIGGIRAMSAGRTLIPDYNEQSLTWLLSMAENKREFGKLHKLALHSGAGDLVGWYLYYEGTAKKAGQVLQFMALPAYVMPALAHLFGHARRQKSFALIGRLDPRLIREHFVQRCLLGHLGVYVQAHSRKPEIVDALMSGNAFLTRMEGEWWTRLQGDEFED